jgi:glycosyltransferase involved in cell wall biosynthesis
MPFSVYTAEGRVKILHLAIVPPAPTTNGHRIRCRSLVCALANEGHRISLLSYAAREELASPSPELAELYEDVQLIPEPRGNPIPGRLKALFSPRPYGAGRCAAAAMRAAVREKLAQSFDAILCEDIYMAGNVPAGCTLPVLLNKHDITYRIVDQFVRGERNWLKKVYGRLEYYKIRRLELKVCASVPAVLACSERDKELLAQDCPSAQIAVLPNVVDVGAYEPASGDDGQTVLFTGAMDWLPNQDGAEYFIRDILPRLRQLTSNMRFMVAGRNPPPEMLRRYGDIPDVHFTGTVRDIRSVIAQAAVCAVSLRIGSGTRMKILEAGAMGKAVVSTTLGAEGLGFRQGEEILLADDPRSFAEAVAVLLKEPALRLRLGHAARLKVEREYSLTVLQSRIAEALAPLCPDPDRAEGTRPMPAMVERR